MLPDSDTVVFTAVEKLVNLTIYNGQFATDPVPEELDKEWTIGAFTVANLNDTDGDGAIDRDDMNGVKRIDERGRNEVDLMRLVIDRPVDGANLLLHVFGSVKIWQESTKETPVPITNGLIAFNDWGTDEPPRTVWVEATAVSGVRQDIQLHLTNGLDGNDEVRATAVWVEKVMIEHDFKSYADLFGAGKPWENAPEGMKERIAPYGGSGLRPYSTVPIVGGEEGEVVGMRDVILFKWQVFPEEMGSYNGVTGENAVNFDVTRRADTRAWTPNMLNEMAPNAEEDGTPIPIENETPNDDGKESDEWDNPPYDDYLYNYDAPGWPGETLLYSRLVVRSNFEEFVRVTFSPVAAPSGNVRQGSARPENWPGISARTFSRRRGISR